MPGIHQSASAQIRRALTLSSGTVDRNGTIVDCLNYQSIRCLVLVGTVDATGACTYKLQEGDVSDLSDATDVVDSDRAITDADDGLIIELDHTLVTHRYYRVVADKNGLANVQEEAIYELYMPKLIFPSDISGEVATIRTQAEQGLYSYTGS